MSRCVSIGWAAVADQEDVRRIALTLPDTSEAEDRAVLVRLPSIDVAELEELIVDAWRCQAPRALVDGFEQGEA